MPYIPSTSAAARVTKRSTSASVSIITRLSRRLCPEPVSPQAMRGVSCTSTALPQGSLREDVSGEPPLAIGLLHPDFQQMDASCLVFPVQRLGQAFADMPGEQLRCGIGYLQNGAAFLLDPETLADTFHLDKAIFLGQSDDRAGGRQAHAIGQLLADFPRQAGQCDKIQNIAFARIFAVRRHARVKVMAMLVFADFAIGDEVSGIETQIGRLNPGDKRGWHQIIPPC